jgi:hypothetical protein
MLSETDFKSYIYGMNTLRDNRVVPTFEEFRMITESDSITGVHYKEINEYQFEEYLSGLSKNPNKVEHMSGERPAVDGAMLALGLHVTRTTGKGVIYTNIKSKDGSSIIYSSIHLDARADRPSMVVLLLKDDDDWFWVYLKCKAAASIVVPYFGSDSGGIKTETKVPNVYRYYRCDQLSGLIELLRSREVKEMATLYAGGTFVYSDILR